MPGENKKGKKQRESDTKKKLSRFADDSLKYLDITDAKGKPVKTK